METTKEVAAEILRQLGGNRFIAMTGATCYSDGPTAIFKFKGSKVANYVRIRLTEMDVYQMTFIKIRGVALKEVAVFDCVFNDQLRSTFEQVTGLRTSL